MNPTSLALLAALVAALYASVVLHHLFPIDLDSAYDARLTRRLFQSAANARPVPLWRTLLRLVSPLTKHVPGANLPATDQQLLWLQLADQWTAWTAEEIWALRLAGATFGLILGLAADPGLTTLVLAGGLFLLPGSRLSSAYEQVSRRVRRELPEVAQSIALQSALGKSIPEALTAILKADTVLSRFFGYALASRPSGAGAVPLLNVQPGESTPGWLLQQAQAAGLKDVIGLAARLEQAARRGVQVDMLLGDVADLAAADYNAEVAARAQQLDTTLSVPLMLGLFVPYLVFLHAPFVQSLSQLTLR